MEKYLSEYMSSTLQFIPPEQGFKIPLKQIYLDYKKFSFFRQTHPLRYKEFRYAFQTILNKTQPLNSNPNGIYVKKYQKRWVVYNVQIKAHTTPEALLSAIYQA